MRYCAFFCEENVWHLCTDPGVVRAGRPVPVEERRVAFISNDDRAVWMRHQRAGRGAEVCWDYHVVLLAPGASGWEVWDQDCVLGMPLALRHWVDESFPAPGTMTGGSPPRFRVVDAARYRAAFSSDRSHMLDEDGRPRQPPPPWEPIVHDTGGSNLMRFVDMRGHFEGEVLHRAQLLERFGR